MPSYVTNVALNPPALTLYSETLSDATDIVVTLDNVITILSSGQIVKDFSGTVSVTIQLIDPCTAANI